MKEAEEIKYGDQRYNGRCDSCGSLNGKNCDCINRVEPVVEIRIASFNSERFRKAIINKRLIESKMQLRECAAKINISASTLSRLENNKIPDVQTFIKVCHWLREPMETFIDS